MKNMTFLILLLCMASAAMGKLSTKVCLSDGNTPLELADPCVPFVYRDIMVGTKLTIIVHSDAGGNWGSDLTIEGEYLGYGLLSARDYNEIIGDYEGSRFEAAGWGSRVWEWVEASIQGFNLDGHTSAVPGDWFIIDYTATAVGECNVAFYDRSISWSDPNYYLTFFHVRTRDFNKDTRVDFSDFAILAEDVPISVGGLATPDRHIRRPFPLQQEFFPFRIPLMRPQASTIADSP